MRARTTFAAVAAAVLVAPCAPTAHAGPAPLVAPGDRITAAGARGESRFCTLGYTYEATNGHTYGFTAGHCAQDVESVRVANSAAIGRVLNADDDPTIRGGADYALLDFGPTAINVPYLGDMPVDTDHPSPYAGDTICRTGVSSGQHCGTVATYYGLHQYLSTGMPDSIPGDSGGPVWMPTAEGHVKIVGIWVGRYRDRSGRHYGLFVSLNRGLQHLGAA